MPELQLEFTVNQKDWEDQIRAFRLNRFKRRETIMSAVFPFLLFGALAVIHKRIADPLAALLIVSPMAALPAYVHFFSPANIAKQRSRVESARTRVQFTIGDEGILIKDGYMETLFKWHCFHSALFTEEYTFLVLDERRAAYHFIPRRAFSSEGQKQTLKTVLESRLPDVQEKFSGREQGVLNLVMALSGVLSVLAFLAAVVLLILRCL